MPAEVIFSTISNYSLNLEFLLKFPKSTLLRMYFLLTYLCVSHSWILIHPNFIYDVFLKTENTRASSLPSSLPRSGLVSICLRLSRINRSHWLSMFLNRPRPQWSPKLWNWDSFSLVSQALELGPLLTGPSSFLCYHRPTSEFLYSSYRFQGFLILSSPSCWFGEGCSVPLHNP